MSAFASHAYETLCDDLSRFDYVLKSMGIDALNENCKASPVLMMEVFEIRSQIEEASEEHELDPIQMEVTCKYDDVVMSIKQEVKKSPKDRELIMY